MPAAVNREDVLSRIGLFESISEGNLHALADICLEKHVTKKQILFLEGDAGHSIYILVTGCIQLYKTSAEGKPIVIKIINPGEMFAEVILFEKNTYPVNAVALKTGMVYMIPKHQFKCLIANESFRDDFMAAMMRKMRYLAQQIHSLSVHDVEDRLVLFLKEQIGTRNQATIALTKRDVANAIATTPETLSRLLVRLKKEGTLRWEGNSLTIHSSFWERAQSPSGSQ
ncbi:MAG: Crp/Fnr family transcriptional regulator [Fibrobacterota bacterium]